MEKQELNFYDLSKKKSFKSKDYKIKIKYHRKFAIAVSPISKKECWRRMPKENKDNPEEKKEEEDA